MPAGQSRSAVIQWQKNVKKQGGCKVHVTHSYAARLSAALRHAPVLHHGRRIHCRPVRPAELCCGHGRPNRAGRARQVRGWPDRHPVLRRLWRMPAALRLLRRQDLTQKAHFYRCAGICHPEPGDGPFRRLLSGHAGAVDGQRHLPILPMVAGGARLLGDDPAQLSQARLRKRRDDLPPSRPSSPTCSPRCCSSSRAGAPTLSCPASLCLPRPPSFGTGCPSTSARPRRTARSKRSR